MIYSLSDPQLLSLLALTIALTASCVIDLQQKILPDPLTLIAFLLGAGLAFFDPIRIPGWESAAIGGLVGFFGSWAFREGVYRVKGVEAMGFGDVKLFGAAGVWVGAEGVVSAALLGSVLTLVVIGIRYAITRKGGMKDEIPFGPGICAGLLITILIGPVGPLIAAVLL